MYQIQWEYTQATSLDVDDWNEAGLDGWELVQIYTPNGNTPIAIFKRELPPPPMREPSRTLGSNM